MQNLMIKVRAAREIDCHDIWVWRNDPKTIENSINQDKIPFDNHIHWFKNALTDSNISIFIAELESKKIGMVRFDLNSEADSCRASINMNPLFRGKGLSVDVLHTAILNYHHNNIIAQIKKQNSASMSIFQKVGFKVTNETDGLIELKLHN